MNEEFGIMNGGTCYPFLKRGYPSIIRHSSFVIPRFHEGFTLVEMLIVVAILAVLMTIAFRISNLGGSDSRRTGTVVKLQKIENCLSGYYAAFGSYPPVRVHGSRDIFTAVDATTGKETRSDGLEWDNVQRACRAQPFGCEYPGSQEDDAVISAWTGEIAERVNNAQDYPKYAESEKLKSLFQGGGNSDFRLPTSGWDDDDWAYNSDWKAIQLFKFGVMSYLLPRYLFMMSNRDIFSGAPLTIPAQWSDNNDTPCNPFKGEPFATWQSVWDLSNTENKSDSQQRNDLAVLANIPSQAVCARWMPNLERTCRTLREMTFFGIAVNQESQTGLGLDDENPPEVDVHYPSNSGGGHPYINASITMLDGYGREFYYYSPAPYQSYVVWSAGPNGKTFPPWMKTDDLESGREEAVEWKGDDIMQMSH